MIKIHEKLWYITDISTEDNLAYMTYYQEDSAFDKRKATGLSWCWGRPDKPEGTIIDNTPSTGFRIKESVSRWSTQNKVFRISDPRGFTVEVPTGNISTLLQTTTVKNGVILDECVWGKEGNNHILLPTNSKEYEDAKEYTEAQKRPLIKVKDIPYGSRVRMNDTTEWIFIGRCKPTWRIKPFHPLGCRRKYLTEYDHTSKTYFNMFQFVGLPGRSNIYECCTTCNVVEVLQEGDGAIHDVDIREIHIYPNVKEDNLFRNELLKLEWKK